jgi:hypothetical protein
MDDFEKYIEEYILGHEWTPPPRENAALSRSASDAVTILSEADFPEEWGDSVPMNAFRARHDVLEVWVPDRIKIIGTAAFRLHGVEGNHAAPLSGGAWRLRISKLRDA